MWVRVVRSHGVSVGGVGTERPSDAWVRLFYLGGGGCRSACSVALPRPAARPLPASAHSPKLRVAEKVVAVPQPAPSKQESK